MKNEKEGLDKQRKTKYQSCIKNFVAIKNETVFNYGFKIFVFNKLFARDNMLDCDMAVSAFEFQSR